MPDEKEKPLEFKIEDNVPIPPPERASLYPWDELKVGQSFFIPVRIEEDRVGVAKKLGVSAAGYARRRGNLKFLVRIVEGGVRVWRVEPSTAES